MVKASLSESGETGLIAESLGAETSSLGAETLCHNSAILCGTEPICALTLALLYCCALYNFFFLGFCQLLSCANRASTFNMNSWLPLFWSTWSCARGKDSATCAGLVHGRDYSYCRAPEKIRKSAWPLFFLELSKILENNGPLWGFFKPHPDYSYVEPRRKVKKVLGYCFSLNCRKYSKTMAHSEGFSNLTPQTAAGLDWWPVNNKELRFKW